MECTCHGGLYNQFCKEHGLGGYYKRRGSKLLRAKADALLDEHALLMRSRGHDGAAHCPCDLAVKYREAVDAFEASRIRFTAEQKLIAMFEKMIDEYSATHTEVEVRAVEAKVSELMGRVASRAGEGTDCQ